jgi:hypothetical protein
LSLNETIKKKHLILLSNIERIFQKKELVSPNISNEELMSDCLELYIKKYDFEGGMSRYLHQLSPNSEEVIIRGPIV